MKDIEIPFGAKDSELYEATYHIPEGMEAIIEGDKVIIRKKEIEDERIRKFIFSIIQNKSAHSECFDGDIKKEDCLAWLEKQCCDKIVEKSKTEKQKVLLTETDGNANIVWDTRSLDDAETLLECGLEYVKKLKATTPYKDADKEYWRGYREGKQEVLDKYAELEKQGEQTVIGNGSNSTSVSDRDTSVTSKEVVSQPTVTASTTVKPKFKVGDFIMNDYCMGRVIELTNDAYLLDTEQGIPFSCEHNVHLWSIADAKNGDVLKEDSCTFIIERMKPDGTAIIHCCLFDDGDFDLGSTLSFDVDSTYPATKEQRDILFQKMKEAGYEWDAENKELKQ